MSEVGNAIKDIIERLAGPYDISMFLKEQREFIEHHLDYLFRTFEGNACSHDKTRTIMGRLERFFESGVEIEFNYKEEYTYHMPKIILTTHDEIIVAYHALEYLFYGNPKKYLPLITEYSKKVLNDSSQDELTTLRAENAQLKANHVDVVNRLRLFTQRDDLPVDRIPAYREIVRLQAENERLIAAGDRMYCIMKQMDRDALIPPVYDDAIKRGLKQWSDAAKAEQQTGE